MCQERSAYCFVPEVVSLAVADVPVHEIMDHVGWKTSKQAMHYIKVKEVLNPAGAAAKLANLSSSATEQFSSWNGLQGFSQAFTSPK